MATAIEVLPLSAVTITGCPACKSQESAVFVAEPQDLEYFSARKEPAKIVRCNNCAALYQTPFPSSAETNTFYGPDYQNYSGSKVPFLSEMLEKQNEAVAQKFIARFGKDAAILDFGCGGGGFLKSLAKAGATALYGYDVSVRFDASGIRIFNDLTAIAASGIKFDVIRMNHVIEHLAEPDDVMKLLAGLLSPQGRIIGQTPNAAHYTAKLFKERWGPLHYPYHTVLFSQDSIAMAAQRWHLRHGPSTPCLMPTGWAMSFENIFKAVIKSKKRGRTMLYTLFILLGAPFAVLDMLRKDTAIFDFELTRA